MVGAMRRLLNLECQGAILGASLDPGAGPAGILFVTGGTQTRIGSHRMFERLAVALAGHGHACFRFDRRGVGDSEGEDHGFEQSGPDILAAIGAFRRESPNTKHITGLGLCDGATALALFGADAGLDAMILVNPWLVEAEAGQPPAAAVRNLYRRRLSSIEGWKKILTGSVSYPKLFKGMLKILSPSPSPLAGRVSAALAATSLPAHLILARGDATAIAAEAEWNSSAFQKVRKRNPMPRHIESDSHTFARVGDMEALLETCLAVVQEGSGRR